jgi:RecJ-like exonuclease
MAKRTGKPELPDDQIEVADIAEVMAEEAYWACEGVGQFDCNLPCDSCDGTGKVMCYPCGCRDQCMCYTR